jgi:hypothetical protein
LAPYLLYDKNYAISGCTISIFSRVNINSVTIAKLIELNKNQVNGNVIHALGDIESQFWNEAIEIEIVKGLEVKNAASLAATALYRNHRQILSVDTLDALEQTAKNQDYLTAQIALTTLCCLTKFVHADIALNKLSNLLILPDQRKRRDIAEALGWATDRGLDLLKTMALDQDTEVRITVVKSLIRNYIDQYEAIIILEILKNDINKDVRDAAITYSK